MPHLALSTTPLASSPMLHLTLPSMPCLTPLSTPYPELSSSLPVCMTQTFIPSPKLEKSREDLEEKSSQPFRLIFQFRHSQEKKNNQKLQNNLPSLDQVSYPPTSCIHSSLPGNQCGSSLYSFPHELITVQVYVSYAHHLPCSTPSKAYLPWEPWVDCLQMASLPTQAAMKATFKRLTHPLPAKPLETSHTTSTLANIITLTRPLEAPCTTSANLLHLLSLSMTQILAHAHQLLDLPLINSKHLSQAQHLTWVNLTTQRGCHLRLLLLPNPRRLQTVCIQSGLPCLRNIVFFITCHPTLSSHFQSYQDTLQTSYLLRNSLKNEERKWTSICQVSYGQRRKDLSFSWSRHRRLQ